MSTAWLIVLVIAAPIVALFLWAVVYTIIRERRFAKLPPRPPLRCPKCKSEQIDEIESGIGCGTTPDGEHHCHSYEYGICKECGTPCHRWVGDEACIVSDEVWKAVVERNETWRKKRESWPFESEHVNTERTENAEKGSGTQKGD
jgi:hypothetical protein